VKFVVRFYQTSGIHKKFAVFSDGEEQEVELSEEEKASLSRQENPGLQMGGASRGN
jgi:hypothetical protein